MVEAEDEDATRENPGKRMDDHGHAQNHPLKDEAWSLASRYRDLERIGYLEEKKRKEVLDRAIQGVVDRAHEMLGPIQKPYLYLTVSQEELEQGLHDYHAPEMDVEETLLNPEKPVFQVKLERDHGLVMVLDTSLSMKGEKLALLATTVAAIELSVPAESFAVIGFDSQIHEIKAFNEKLSLHELIRRVLSIPPGGLTNISKGIDFAKKWIQASRYQQARVILISDGRYTEGVDPVEVSKSLPFVYPVKIGKEPTGRNLMKQISDTGLGSFLEVRDMADLPDQLLKAIRRWVK